MAKILLAEDDEIMRITLQDRLEKNKWTVDAVSDGKEAIMKLHNTNYDLVITDVRMPGVDGWQLLRFIRQSFSNIDIIMMTGFGSPEDEAESLQRGAAHYILKPFNMDDLVGRVRGILEMQALKKIPAEDDRTP